MDINSIVNISFLAVLFVAQCAILRWDTFMLQQKNFSTGDYYDWVRSSDEVYSTKRISLLAIMLAFASSFATDSWMVMVILTIATLALAIYLFRLKCKFDPEYRKRMLVIYLGGIETVIEVAAASMILGDNMDERIRIATYTVLFFTAFSYVLTIAMNWFVNIFKKPKNQDEETDAQNGAQE
ncbi:MAG: hypothetical protein Q4B68_04085 [Bacteroidales bacterium]|nr:hypothetical protein [Bacteroidales bacterium]